jgi:hypothetical protein
MHVVDAVHRMKAQAVAVTGLSDFGDDWFEGPLSAWAADLGRGKLSPESRQRLAVIAIADLCKRLRVVDCLKRNPEIEDAPIPPIIYVTGLARSGTTFLHHLLSLGALARPLLRWELTMPTPPPEAATYRTDPRIAKIQEGLEKLRGKPLEQMHWVNADEPDECTVGAYDCTGLLGRAITPLMPGWRQWLHTNDLGQSYVEYRRLIKLLLWRNPVAPGGYLVLKSPQNARDIARFCEVFPEARVVIIHRDPYRAAVSSLALQNQITRAFSPKRQMSFEADRSGAAGIVLAIETILESLSAFVGNTDRRVANPLYARLVKDPAGVVRSIHETIGIDAPADIEDRIAALLAAQAAGKRKAPIAELPTRGLDQSTFLARQSIAAYMQRFNVEPEWTRQTGASSSEKSA